MEASEEKASGLLTQIVPPRLEDAGLEDCALPPDSIKEAFLKAATAVKSRAAVIFATDEDDFDGDACVGGPWPESKDVVVGDSPELRESLGPCVAVKGAGATVEIGGEDVVVIGAGEGKEERKDCVDGLQGLEIGDEMDKKTLDDEEEEERPTLIQGYI